MLETIATKRLNQRITILKKAAGQDSGYGTEQVAWVPLGDAWADVQDMLPSRAERIAEGITLSARPCRVRLRYRTDIASDMRLLIDGRTFQIVAGPATLGFREGIELLAEEVSTLGNAA